VKPVAAAGVLRRALPCEPAEAAPGANTAAATMQGDGAWGHFTRRHAVALLFMREHVPALRSLERGPWACLQAIAPHWQGGRSDAFPGQERLALLTGYDARSIRDFTKQLEACGVLNLVRLKLSDGTARLHYQPGPALLAAVDQFDARYSDERPKPGETAPNGRAAARSVRARPLAVGDDGHRGRRPPEMVSGGGAAATSGELPDPRDQKNASFCLATEPEAGASNDEPSPQPSELDRNVAREVLGALRERRFGRRVGLFDTKVVAMVAACVSAVGGDREAKLRAQMDAIQHAFAVSRGTPTPSFVWGSIDHFLDHETQGRGARVEAERALARQARAAEAERLRARELAQHEREACGPPPEVLQFMAEFQRGKA